MEASYSKEGREELGVEESSQKKKKRSRRENGRNQAKGHCRLPSGSDHAGTSNR